MKEEFAMSLPSFFSGIAVTVIGGLILYLLTHFLNYFRPKPKLFWYSEHVSNKSKGTGKSQNFNRIVIDNLGKGSAEWIKISIGGKIASIDIIRSKIGGPRRLDQFGSSDHDFKIEENDSVTAVELKNVLRKTRVQISYFDESSIPIPVKAVTAKETEVRISYGPEIFLTRSEIFRRCWDICTWYIFPFALIFLWYVSPEIYGKIWELLK